MTKAKNSPTLLELGALYATKYINGTLTEQMIVKFKSVREVLYECYLILIRNKELAPIESLSEAEKAELWAECKKFCGSLPAADRIKFVKAYGALGCLMRKSEIKNAN